MRITHRKGAKPRSQEGMAVIVVITILSIILIWTIGNVRTLNHLGNELRFVESRQRARIQMPPDTNWPGAWQRSMTEAKSTTAK